MASAEIKNEQKSDGDRGVINGVPVQVVCGELIFFLASSASDLICYHDVLNDGGFTAE
jgi:hypothetical protein